MMVERSRCFRLATKSDVSSVVGVHRAAFPGFFLTLLGPAFLRAMYDSFLFHRGGVFIVAELDGRICGFAVGVIKSSGMDRDLAKRFLLRFIISAVPGLVRSPIKVARRLVTRFLSGGEEYDVPEGAVVLRSIGVLPEVRGGGAAGELLQAFERQVRGKGATSVALTTDAENNDRAIRFYLKHDYDVVGRFYSIERRSMLLMSKSL